MVIKFSKKTIKETLARPPCISTAFQKIKGRAAAAVISLKNGWYPAPHRRNHTSGFHPWHFCRIKTTSNRSARPRWTQPHGWSPFLNTSTMQSQMKSIISFHPSVQFSAESYEHGPLSAQRTVEPDPFRFYSITKENKRRSRARRVLHRLISKERNRSKTGHEGAASPQPSQYLRTADLPFRTGGISPPGSHPWHFCLHQLKFSSAELNLKKNSHHIWHLVYKINPIPRKVKSCFTKKTRKFMGTRIFPFDMHGRQKYFFNAFFASLCPASAAFWYQCLARASLSATPSPE